MSFCNILNKAGVYTIFTTQGGSNLRNKVPSLKELRLIYAQAPVSGIGLVPGRTIYSSLRRRLARQCLPFNPRVTVGVPTSTTSVQVGQMVTDGLGYILCNLTNNSPLSYHTRDKLGCSIISYRNITALFSSHFLGDLSPNLKLSFNRGNSTSLLNSYLTKLCRLFSLFYNFGYHKKLNMEGKMSKCDCVRGFYLCPIAEHLWRQANTLYQKSKRINDYREYDKAIAKYMRHFPTTENASETPQGVVK